MLKDALSSLFAHVNAFVCGQFSAQRDAVPTLLLRKKDGIYMPQTVDKKLFSPEGGRIALPANERIAEFLDFAIQAKFAYVNKLRHIHALSVYLRLNST